jgi:hypothetical protein
VCVHYFTHVFLVLNEFVVVKRRMLKSTGSTLTHETFLLYERIPPK